MFYPATRRLTSRDYQPGIMEDFVDRKQRPLPCGHGTWHLETKAENSITYHPTLLFMFCVGET